MAAAAVARGLYRDAPLVIADEPTAALDARAEQAVFGTLHGRTGAGAERITVLVTHRLANVRFADQILVLERGRVIERGRHAELMALRGTYFELFTLQARAYGGMGHDMDGIRSAHDRARTSRGGRRRRHDHAGLTGQPQRAVRRGCAASCSRTWTRPSPTRPPG